ncbi:hypothetical protein VW23_009630 [Devosia insulae DS-56]|uniref:DUF1127 domain-containing protein n=1 Tax=Devosia insulae DS-56 TaxID=1116389 RepID=A0A1E5XW62_9HYPH|nr:hypothetical protein [Devosia insulae]OEO32836.1 hypothetical protein VW23_009630 [Devosia insulae DS-56]
MALVDVTKTDIVEPSAAYPLPAISRWLAKRRVERQRRLALQSLLFAPEHRLRDLGISHDELLRAIAQRH